MPIESGTAMRSASAAAQTVPKSERPTYSQKFVVRMRGVLGWSRPTAGMLCTIRKMATAASVTRIIDPANTAEPEKTRSPVAASP